MSHRMRLKLASLLFAVLWILVMIWSLSPLQKGQLGLLMASTALAGLVWYWLYGSWYRWYVARRVFPRKRTT